MKKYILLLSLLAVSCSMEESFVPEILEYHNTVFTAVAEDFGGNGTRSMVDSEGKFTWSKDDRINVWAENGATGAFFTFTLDEGSDGQYDANFRGTLPEGYVITDCAIYPASDRHVYSGGKFMLHLPSEYGDFDTEYSPNLNAIMIAREMIVDGEVSPPSVFRHLAGVLRLTLDNVPAGAAQVVFTANVGVTGDFEVIPSREEGIRTAELTESNNTVSIKFKPLEHSRAAAMDFYFPLPEGDYAGFSVALQDKDGNVLWSKAVEKTNKITRRTLSSLPKVSCMTTEEIEREALMALYKATDGDNWTNNENWCSDKPLNEWYGVSAYSGKVRSIWMSDNNLSGNLPGEIGNLANLIDLNLAWNHLTGPIPSEIGNLTNLVRLYLYSNKTLNGAIPSEIGNLSELRQLNLYWNEFTEIPEELYTLTNLAVLNIGKNPIKNIDLNKICKLANLVELDLEEVGMTCGFPTEIGNLTNLYKLNLRYNSITGCIPSEIGNLHDLELLWLYGNELTGSIPDELGDLRKLRSLELNANYLSGRIPESVTQLQAWADGWIYVIGQRGEGFDLTDTYFPAPSKDFVTTDLFGNSLSFAEEYANNEYTILLDWASWCSYSRDFINKLLKVYDVYKSNDIEIIGISYDTEPKEDVLKYIEESNIPWKNIQVNLNDLRNQYKYPIPSGYPSVKVIKDEAIVFMSEIQSRNDIFPFFENIIGSVEPDEYVSTDFSADGKVRTVQTATIGNGIDVVLMGDAYSDREIAAGDYDADIERSVEALFSEEPYKSFRDHFNVYAVTAVSKNEGYVDGGSTVFEGFFGEGTHVGGNDNTALNYARKAIPDERVDEAVVIVMMNRDYYAGTCYMYGSDYTNDYGGGVSVSYFPASSYYEEFRGTILHEAFGHGFAKLDDEYAYEHYGEIPSAEIEKLNRLYLNYGWSKNVDVTDDPAQVKWRHFLEDPRYSADGLGVFEGAATYWSGVWRPTENSIMNNNTGGFNAPSREAIYYRIHKLAYGAEWQYDYEKFVDYDAINRNVVAVKSAVHVGNNDNFVPLAPPVVYEYSWREIISGR